MPDEVLAQPLVDVAATVQYLPAIAAVPTRAAPGSSTSNPADQEAFMQKADAVFKLTAPKETALDVKPPTELAPEPIKLPRYRVTAATKGSRTVFTSFSPTDPSFSSPHLLQHGDSGAFTSAAAGEDDLDDCPRGEWEGDELMEEDVIVAAMQELAEGDEITAAMQQLQDDDDWLVL